jgi:hypothetical protein
VYSEPQMYVQQNNEGSYLAYQEMPPLYQPQPQPQAQAPPPPPRGPARVKRDRPPPPQPYRPEPPPAQAPAEAFQLHIPDRRPPFADEGPPGCFDIVGRGNLPSVSFYYDPDAN